MPAMRLATVAALLAAALMTAAPASAKTAFAGVQAHRGGPLTNGKPTGYENSLEGFKAGHAAGADVIELDVKLTKDNVPVIMHDDTLDRTTTCSGPVKDKTLSELAACRIDQLGWSDVHAVGPNPVAIPTMAAVLAWAKQDKVKLSLEIKNIPTDNDYDPTSAFADTVLGGIEASGIPKSQVLIQSFWPANLDRAKAKGFQTSYLVLSQVATKENLKLVEPYTLVSPGWPVVGDAKAYVDAAHAMGKPVIPYTLDTAKDQQDAIDAGVDAFITNDIPIGLKTLYGPACDSAKAAEKKAKTKYKKAKKPAAKKKAKKALAKATKARKAACTRAGE
jgi:glycerophosphoryl diester phosphodiesterase